MMVHGPIKTGWTMVYGPTLHWKALQNFTTSGYKTYIGLNLLEILLKITIIFYNKLRSLSIYNRYSFAFR